MEESWQTHREVILVKQRPGLGVASKVDCVSSVVRIASRKMMARAETIFPNEGTVFSITFDYAPRSR